MKKNTVSTLKVKPIDNQAGFKIVDISGQIGDVLAKHRTDRKAVLLVRTGNVLYKEDERIVPLSSGDAHDIPPNVYHQLDFTTNAKLFLIMARDSKIEFK